MGPLAKVGQRTPHAFYALLAGLVAFEVCRLSGFSKAVSLGFGMVITVLAISVGPAIAGWVRGLVAHLGERV